MIVLGLTGSIGMGKTTIGAMLKNMRIPVHEADKQVHFLLAANNSTRYAVAAAFPYFEYPQIYDKKSKSINRKELGVLVFFDDEKREILESILHPLVQQSQMEFLRGCVQKGVEIACLDIPLLFETGAQHRVDYTITATAPAFLQRERVLSRPDMNEEKFEAILSRQMPDAQKRTHADYVIQTGLGRAHALKSLKLVLEDIQTKVGKTK